MGLFWILVDLENMLVIVNKIEKIEFLGFFYKYCMYVFIVFLLVNIIEDKFSKDDF